MNVKRGSKYEQITQLAKQTYKIYVLLLQRYLLRCGKTIVFQKLPNVGNGDVSFCDGVFYILNVNKSARVFYFVNTKIIR